MLLRLSSTLGLCALSLATAGCFAKNDRLPVHHVTGGVFVNGKPAVGARLFFHPAANPSNPRALRPFAEVGDDGSFELSTYLAGDGAPAGEYVVTVFWPAPAPPRKGKFEDESTPRDQLKNTFSDPRTSKLRAQIHSGENVLSPFQLPDQVRQP